jgi:hypothetical protein
MMRFFIAAVALLGFLSVPWYILTHRHPAAVAATSTPAAETANPSSATYQNATEKDIFVHAPHPGQSLTQSFVVTGYARGTWFFEAVFPVEVRNKKDVVIGTAQGRADSDWMTTDLVPFTAEINLKALYNGPATIVLRKDNPSGDPARDASISIPVMIQ